MNPNGNILLNSTATRRNSGIALLDVILAMAIFALGMLALVQLQGSLARGSADANARTVAANLAEEMVETLRGYRTIQADPDNNLWDYTEMNGGALSDSVSRGGIDYTRAVTVSNFWWDDTNENYIRTEVGDTEPPESLSHRAYPNFKLLRLEVSWGNSDDFYVNDGATADLGTGSVVVYEIISSTPGVLGAQLASALDGQSGPLVQYNPGDNPDIIAIKLDNDGKKFKESTSARPTTFHDEFVETWFDVVTWSIVSRKDEEGNEVLVNAFQRREEFVAVSCECTLKDDPSDAEKGYMPTLWNGVSYTEGLKAGVKISESVVTKSKPIGVAEKTVSQSAFCDICCRDHHDPANGTAEEVYNLANIGSGGDHPHYQRDKKGLIPSDAEPVQSGQNYVEACRLVRKDGFMRVTQDASQQTLIGFPEGYLEFDEGVEDYSDYVTASVESYYDMYNSTDPKPTFPEAVPSDFPNRDPSYLPTTNVANPDEQQMRARSVYTDYLTPAAQKVISDCFSDPKKESCAAPYATDPLEIYPFFDLQMTYLANWLDVSGNDVVSVTSEPIKTDDPSTPGPEYDRGIVGLGQNSAAGGIAEVSINSEKGNLGLTATAPIDKDYVDSVEFMHVEVNGNTDPKPPIGNTVSGSLSSAVKKVSTAKIMLDGNNAICGNTYTEWSCVAASGGTLLVSGYYVNNTQVYVCSDLGAGAVSGSGETLTTSFELPVGGGSNIDIWLTTDISCTP